MQLTFPAQTFLLIYLITSVFSAQASVENTGECASCHTVIAKKWQSSHHAKSIQRANATSVIADFDNTQSEHYGQKAKFTKNDKLFTAEISYLDANNKLLSKKTYTVEYTFGFSPLQQYLVKTDKGRLQVLPFAWDTRDASKGGQRWMHLYPHEEIAPDDRLHWLQPLQNWNGMCADCHSDGFKRNYDASADAFSSDWVNLSVDCMSCHDGLPKNHHQLNSNKKAQKTQNQWSRAEGARTASLSSDVKHRGNKENREGLDVCYACHSLRQPLTDGFQSNAAFLDQFSPTLPSPPLYHADGQIKDEVYVFGSFLQSKMHAAGVGCLDCHDAHSYELKEKGNALCAQCHDPKVFDRPDHHKHSVGGAGSQCVDCHMPSQVYMNVNHRRDHSFRIPRPELTKQFGVPNACQNCHEDKGLEWLLQKTKTLYPKKKAVSADVFTFISTMSGKSHDVTRVLSVANGNELPPIKRAALIERLPAIVRSLPGAALMEFLNDKHALIRLAAIRASSLLTPDDKARYVAPRLSDEYRAVRVAAAEQLLDVIIPQAKKPAFQKAFAELVNASEQSLWRGEGRLNHGLLLTRVGNIEGAVESYRQGIEVDPYFTPAYINLTDVYRAVGAHEKAEKVYQEGLQRLPESAVLHYSFGLHYVRQKQLGDAIEQLGLAKKLAPGDTQYAYMYYLARHTHGETLRAYCELTNDVRNYSNNGSLRQLLQSFRAALADIPARCDDKQ